MLFILIAAVLGFEFSRREVQILNSQVQSIKETQIGDVILSMVKYESKDVRPFIESYIDDIDQAMHTESERHQKQQQLLLKDQQSIQLQLMDAQDLLGDTLPGTAPPDQLDKLRVLISERSAKVEQKNLMVHQLKQSVSTKIDEYDEAIAQVDSLISLINDLATKEPVGIEFMQMKGQVNKHIESLHINRASKAEIPIIKPIVLMAIKENMRDTKLKDSLQNLLYQMRSRLVEDLNKQGIEEQQRIFSIEKEVDSLQSEISKMKLKVQDELNFQEIQNAKLNQMKEYSTHLSIQQARLQQEFNLIKNQVRVENTNFINTVKNMQDQKEQLEGVLKMLNQQLVAFIQQ